MLSNDILNTLSTYTKSMQQPVSLVLQSGKHEQRDELVAFLSSVCSVSPHLSFEQSDEAQLFRSPITFGLRVNGQYNGITFSGIPSGHEFNSLILAILQSSGTPLKLDETVSVMISNINQPLKFEVFVSLSCHNCPEVVQALNQFALLNNNISTEMIDGGLFQTLVAERNIQGVPSVYLNGELFANGKVDIAQLLEKLVHKFPAINQKNNNKPLPRQDVTVIGGGPAGIAAAIYSARKGLKVTLIADRIGGQVKDTVGIENLISIPSTTGPALTNNLLAHLNEYNVNLKEHLRVENIQSGEVKTLLLSSGEIIESKAIIIATGAKWRELGIPGEQENIGKGVAYCPHCDGPFFKGKDVAVIGGGNSGIEAALDLAGIVKQVTVFEFLPELKADQVLIERAKKRENIIIIKHAATKEVIADNGKVVALDYIDRTTNQQHRHALSAVFVQIGLLPNSQFVADLVERTQFGEIIINEKGQTSSTGIFACGDVTTVPYKQIVVAMGEGAKAALAAFEYVSAA